MAGVAAAVTIPQIIACSERGDGTFALWLKDRRNSRQIPHRFEAAGYLPVRNDYQADGRWKVRGKNVVIYARRVLSFRERFAAAKELGGR
jgi:hypothetical protein